MNDFVDYDLGSQPQGAAVEVTLGHRANVLLLDAANFRRYRAGGRYEYFGGEPVRSPVVLTVPHTDHWHVVLDLGGASGNIESAVRVLET